MRVIDKLERYLLTEIVVDSDKESISSEEDLLEQGIIDSMGIMKITAHLEDTYGIKVSDDDLVPENFQTLKCLAGFVESKKQGN